MTDARREHWARAIAARAATHWTPTRTDELLRGKAVAVRPAEGAVLLRALGILADDGTLPPGRVGKYFQVNHMVALLGAALLALVPGALLLLGAASIFGRNVVLPLKRDLGDAAQLWVSRAAMVAFAGIAVWLTLTSNKSLVEIGLSAYGAIGMLAPGVFLAFLWPRASAIGVFAGIVAGYVALLLPAAAPLWQRIFPEWDTGLVAMLVNVVVAILASLVVPARAPRAALPASG